MPRLLIVHHTPSPSTHEMLDAVRSGATDDAIEGVEVATCAALSASATDVLGADGYILGTPADLGYMSGALKHFFDQIYYPCLGESEGRVYGMFVHGNSDTTGAVRAIGSIAEGLGWRRARDPVEVVGQPRSEDLEACWELGGALAAGLVADIA